MSVYDIIPTCDNEMSVYTLCVFAILVSALILFATIYIRYNSNVFRGIEHSLATEVKKLESAICTHDNFIETVTGTINQIHIDLAVQESSMKDVKTDIADIKSDIAETKRDIKTLLSR